MRIGDLGFLVGRWSGEGTVRGEAVTTRSECARAADGSLRLDVEIYCDLAAVHQEPVEFREDPAGTVAATTRPREGVVQTWEVSGDASRIRLRHPGFAWEMTPLRDAYEETFDTVAPDGRATRIVALRHARRGEPAR